MNEIKKLIGKRIKELRKEHNLSQQELAELINIDQRNLSNIECGISFPSKSLLQIAEAFDISLKDLFDFEHLTLKRTDMLNYIENKIQYLDDRNIKFIYKIIKSLFWI